MFIHLKSFVLMLHLILTCGAIGLSAYTDYCLYLERNNRVMLLSRMILKDLQWIMPTLLAALWFTGTALLILNYADQGCVVFDNQKLWGKILIVFLLTINGVLLHLFVFPLLMMGERFSHFSLLTKIKLTFAGSFSSAGWSAAAYLGIARHLNHSISLENVLIFFSAWWVLIFVLMLVCIRRDL